MLVSEFTKLTGYVPTMEEYNEIESLYYDFDGDKFEFCKAWVKLNPAKAGTIDRERKQAQAIEKEENKVISIITRYVFKSHKEVLTAEGFKALFSGTDKATRTRVIRNIKDWRGVTQNWTGDAVWRNYWNLFEMVSYGY